MGAFTYEERHPAMILSYNTSPRPLDAIRADILELERESEGLLAEIIGSKNSG